MNYSQQMTDDELAYYRTYIEQRIASYGETNSYPHVPDFLREQLAQIIHEQSFRRVAAGRGRR